MQVQDGKSAARSVVYIDGNCRHCRLAGAWLERLDLQRTLAVQSFRHDFSYLQYGISLVALEQDIHLVRGAEVFRGFAAVTELSRQLPLLWPLFPFFLLAERAGFGQRYYHWLAARRLIVPDAGHCEAEGRSTAGCLVSVNPD